MALPKQVEQQLREVEEIERSLTVQPEQTESETPVAEAQPEGDANEAQPTNVVELKQPEVSEETWQQKYHTLQGKFDAEVPRLHQQNKELAAQMQVLYQQLQTLQSQPQQQTTPQEDRLVTEKDEEAFGSDLIDVQRRIAKEVMRDMVKPLQSELAARDAKIAQLEAQLNKTGGEVTNMTFEQRLARAIPDFEAINNDPKWIAWLNEIDPYTDEPRRSYAEYVYNNGDIEKLTKVVKFYKESTGQQQQQQQRSQRQTELNRQTQPTRSATTSTPPVSDRTYTEPEWNRLWNKVNELHRKGNSAEAEQLENELSLAATQGRVR